MSDREEVQSITAPKLVFADKRVAQLEDDHKRLHEWALGACKRLEDAASEVARLRASRDALARVAKGATEQAKQASALAVLLAGIVGQGIAYAEQVMLCDGQDGTFDARQLFLARDRLKRWVLETRVSLDAYGMAPPDYPAAIRAERERGE